MTVHKKIIGSGNTTLIISNEEKNDIMKIVESHEGSGLLMKVVSETIKNEAKEQKGWMVLGTLVASLLVSLLRGKGKIKADECTVRASQDFYATSLFHKF